MNVETASIAEMVAALPEVYQPIFGHPELSENVSRSCDDRLNLISDFYRALSHKLDRPLRVLDLGCAQGYISLNLARLGARVVGVDFLTSNIAVCNALLGEHSGIDVRFEHRSIEETISAIASDDYDIVLGLSVLHHLCHEHGKEKVREWIATLSTKVTVSVFELALATEPVYWAVSLYEDERDLVKSFAFVHEIGRFGTHLSDVSRPLYICSNRVWYLGGEVGFIESSASVPHLLAGDWHKDTRRYYTGEGKVVKYFRLKDWIADLNEQEIRQEAKFLSAPPSTYKPIPKLVGWQVEGGYAWLVREALEGGLLVDLIYSKQPYDERVILLDVLTQLAILESAGLYHSDVRAWNVIVDRGGHAALIDFGSISSERRDGGWPYDLFLAFFMFVREVTSRSVDRVAPIRQPFVSPYNLPAPYGKWAQQLWKLPVKSWSFGLMLQKLKRVPRGEGRPESRDAEALWTQAMERYLDAVGWHLNQTQAQIDKIGSRQNKQDSAFRDYLSGLREQGERLQEELIDAHEQLTEAKADVAHFRYEVHRLGGELRAALDEQRSLQAQLTAERDRAARTDGELTEVRRQVVQLDGHLRDAHEQLVRTERDVTQSREEAGRLAGELRAALDEQRSLQAQLTAERDRAARTDGMLMQVQERAAKSEDEAKRLERELRLTEVEQRNLEIRLIDEQDKLARAEGGLTELRAHATQLDLKVLSLSSELSAIQASRSWRITAPIRALSSMCRAVVGSVRRGGYLLRASAKRRVKSVLLVALRSTRKRPRVKTCLRSLLVYFPWLANRLRTFARANFNLESASLHSGLDTSADFSQTTKLKPYADTVVVDTGDSDLLVRAIVRRLQARVVRSGR